VGGRTRARAIGSKDQAGVTAFDPYRVAEFEWPHITVEILVERESQKGMVIGKGGQLLKDVGIAARRQLPEGCFLELKVRVEPGWQKRDDILDRFGY